MWVLTQLRVAGASFQHCPHAHCAIARGECFSGLSCVRPSIVRLLLCAVPPDSTLWQCAVGGARILPKMKSFLRIASESHSERDMA